MSNFSCQTSITQNGFEYICADKIAFIKLVAAITFLIVVLLTVIGNALVILVIMTEKRLQTPSNYLILSLALTDLFTGLTTVPIRAVNEIKDFASWPYGAVLCDIRVVVDKLCVYGSIYHLLAIAVDRYFSVTNVQYSLTRSTGRIFSMILVVWIAAFAVSMAPVFGWRDEKYQDRIARKICLASAEFSLNLTVWIVVFVIPITIMTLLYIRVYQIAKKSIQQKPGRSKSVDTSSQMTSSHSKGTASTDDSGISDSNCKSQASTVTVLTACSEQSPRQTADEHREKKVARTLFVVTACVVICWLPFFTNYTLVAIFGIKFASNSHMPFKITIWLGYLNSLLNPFIYAVTNPYYRHGFKKLLGIQ